MFQDLIAGDEYLLASRCTKRRAALLKLIAEHHQDKQGSVFLFAPLEMDHQVFIQDSSFFYFTEIREPACVVTYSMQEPTVFYQPNFGSTRAQWMDIVDVVNDDTKALYGFDSVKFSGQPLAGYSMYPYFAPEAYQNVIDLLTMMVAKKQFIFTTYPTQPKVYAMVKMLIDRLALFVPGLLSQIVDISDLIAMLRRKKDMHEIEMLHKAAAITDFAFQAAAYMIKPGAFESEVQAALEYIFTEHHARAAYQSIVASGKNATILHYHTNRAQLKAGDAILIDAGAMLNHYCADITRVFPISGIFSKRQKELYEIVLATQQHVADFAKPGVWLNNAQEQENSLQHIAMNFLKKSGGYDQYFPHGIGHFLGLDVHDVGGRNAKLQAGDVITLEPGIYIPSESIGIRIEDNYWIIQDQEAVCLSENIAKSVKDVQQLVQKS